MEFQRGEASRKMRVILRLGRRREGNYIFILLMDGEKRENGKGVSRGVGWTEGRGFDINGERQKEACFTALQDRGVAFKNLPGRTVWPIQRGMSFKLLLLRHCAATGQEPEAALTTEGEREAGRLADLLMGLGVDAAWASPYRRAVQSLEPWARRAGLELRLDPRLVERRLESPASGEWLGHLRRSFADIHYRAPGGETLAEAQERGVAALAAVVASGCRRPVVATHGNLLAGLLQTAEPGFGFEEWRGLRNPDLFEVEFAGGRVVAFARVAGSGG